MRQAPVVRIRPCSYAISVPCFARQAIPVNQMRRSPRSKVSAHGFGLPRVQTCPTKAMRMGITPCTRERHHAHGKSPGGRVAMTMSIPTHGESRICVATSNGATYLRFRHELELYPGCPRHTSASSLRQTGGCHCT